MGSSREKGEFLKKIGHFALIQFIWHYTEAYYGHRERIFTDEDLKQIAILFVLEVCARKNIDLEDMPTRYWVICGFNGIKKRIFKRRIDETNIGFDFPDIADEQTYSYVPVLADPSRLDYLKTMLLALKRKKGGRGENKVNKQLLILVHVLMRYSLADIARELGFSYEDVKKSRQTLIKDLAKLATKQEKENAD